jgi:hypothetical protein
LRPSGNISSYSYTYNPVGTISSWALTTASNSQTKTFNLNYDLADELVSALMQVNSAGTSTQAQFGYSYDQAGNRTGFQNDLDVASATANSLNQVTQVTTGQGLLTVFGTTNRPSTVTVNNVSAKSLASNAFQAQIPASAGQNTIAPLVAHSPLFNWLQALLGTCSET